MFGAIRVWRCDPFPLSGRFVIHGEAVGGVPVEGHHVLIPVDSSRSVAHQISLVDATPNRSIPKGFITVEIHNLQETQVKLLWSLKLEKIDIPFG